MAVSGDQQEVQILLLGDAEVGKSVFLSRLSVLKDGPHVQRLPALSDSEQPFNFDVSFGKKSYRLQFFDTASPTSYTLLRPDVIVLCFSIVDRASLESLHTKWKYTVETVFNYNAHIPVIVVGLKRDLRKEHDPASIHPNEALAVAQAMRCDRYCEGSAITGELMPLVFEDICRTAAATTTGKGGQSEGTNCALM